MIADLIFILLVLVFGIIWAKKGFTLAVLSFLNKIVSLVVAVLLAKPVATVLSSTIFGTWAETLANKMFSSVTILQSFEILSNASWWILLAMSFIVAFIGLMIIFQVAKVFAKAITSLPIIKQVDSLLGFALGAVTAVAICYVILAFTFGMQDFVSTTAFFESIESSYLVSYLYNNNIVINYFFG